MATTPIAPVPTPAKRARKANGTASTKHTVTLSFEGKYAGLYDTFKVEAEKDDRPLHVYLLRLLAEVDSNTTA